MAIVQGAIDGVGALTKCHEEVQMMRKLDACRDTERGIDKGPLANCVQGQHFARCKLVNALNVAQRQALSLLSLKKLDVFTIIGK